MKTQIFVAFTLVAVATLSGGGSRLTASMRADTTTTNNFDDLAVGSSLTTSTIAREWTSTRASSGLEFTAIRSLVRSQRSLPRRVIR
jgi:hypothetical protein